MEAFMEVFFELKGLFELGNFSKNFFGWCTHEVPLSLSKGFLELGPQWGINRGTTSHYL
jgi:hypothetical protein